jgi:Tfp pilus assembly protein FimT
MEMLVVLAILGLLLAWGGVYLVANLDDYRINGATRDLLSTMIKARMTAVRNNAETAVFFDPANDTYCLCTDSGDGDWSTREDNICPQVVDLASYASGIGYGHGRATRAIGESFGSDEISYTSYTSNRVVFTSRGTARQAGYAYIANAAGDTRAVGTITIGTIMAKQWNGAAWEAY